MAERDDEGPHADPRERGAVGPDGPEGTGAGGADEGGRDGREGLRSVSEALRKAISQGYRAVQGEDGAGIKGRLADVMPKELAVYVMRQTDAAKDEAVRIIGNQVRKFLENLDLGAEIQKILTSVSFEVRTEIRFVPNDAKAGEEPKGSPKVKPKARARVSIKARDDVKDDDVDESARRAAMGALREVVGSALSRFQRDSKMDLEVELEDEEAQDLPTE